ncbi:MAG: glycosyltransferase, partial [Bacteroidota bacterium]
SYKETWGLVLNEAMASGLPVVVSERMGATEDLVTHGWNGFVFNPARTNELADLMVHVHGLSPDARAALIVKGRQRVAGWSPERFGEGLWRAFSAGRESSDRSLGLLANALLTGQRVLARRIDSFHAT